MEPPEEPDQADCCNSGCNPCILDVYEEKLRKYRNAIHDENLIKNNCIHETKYTKFKLINQIELTCTTSIYIFELFKDAELDENVQVLYKPSQHFLIKSFSKRIDGDFTRAYTPIPMENLNKTQFAVMIKLYDKGDMSSYIRRLKLGQNTLWRGPYGDFKINHKQQHALFIAQGTGIAPIYAILKDMLNNEECETIIYLFFCCRSNDIPLRDEVYSLTSHWNFNYKIFLADASEFEGKYNENYHVGRLETNEIAGYVDGKEDIHIGICGGVIFSTNMNVAVNECGLSDESVHVF